MTGRVVHVELTGAAYDVVIEPGLLARLGTLVAAVAPSPSAILAVDERIVTPHGEPALRSLREAGYATTVITLTAEESHKTLATVSRMYEQMLRSEVLPARTSPVVALGGGIVGDTAGFAAATYLRGLPLVQVPTTLLAMVDAAIGGKTGVNIALPDGGLGKNLIGAFWQPRAVLVDPDVLDTLTRRDFRCGLAECVKAGVIADESLLEFLAERAVAILDLDTAVLGELIERTVRIKVGIVREDERETGRRALLNLGHTFAHAIEAQPHVEIRHGEAVSIGLTAAMEVAVRTGRMTDADRGRVTGLLETFGLPLRMPQRVELARLLRAMQYDKKAISGRIRLVIPEGLGSASVTDDVPDDVVAAAWACVGARE
ncbi:MAG: 3-dehydroquinate synthase [Planctomycetes bacterium]|nr:3-dehydroquinate synthase [Planctomycetota bacterium]